MGERISEEKLNEIRHAIDIVDLISDYVPLKKQGRNYFGLCPFHGEKTPSFSVSPEKQIYHCFGCGAGGNIFSFLMDIEGLSFQEAAIKLAQRVNIDLEISASHSKRESFPKDIKEIIDVHELLRKFYHHLLINTKEGQKALEYLLDRGFDKDSIEKFQIGYALDSWDFVYKFLTKRNYQPKVLEKAGLIIKRQQDGTYFDRFRDRIMFPIIDHHGNTVAFSGRTLGVVTGEPKYLNSPETAVFNKSKILYNFYSAKPMIRKKQELILLEGFVDCIAAVRSGVENVVATMGTALTEEHISVIRKNVQTVTICYDSDDAGIEAAYRAGNMLADSGCQVHVALMPAGLDPDDYIKKYGGEKFRSSVIESSITFIAFKLLYFKRGKNLQHEADRLNYINQALQEISQLNQAVEKDVYLRHLAEEFSLSLEALKEQEKQIALMNRRKNKKENPYESFVSLKQAQSLKPAYENAERCLIYYMMRDQEIAYMVQEMLAGNPLNIDEHQAIITYLFGFYEKGFDPNPMKFMDYVDDKNLKRIIADIEMMSINENVSEQAISDYIQQVLNYQKMLKIKEKQAEQKEAERQNDLERAVSIANEIIQIKKSLLKSM